MTINDLPRDVVATHIVKQLSLGDRNSWMRASKACRAICQYDPVWAPMVEELFLKKQGTNYETVRDFHLRFNAFSDANLPKPEPVSFFARTGNWLKSLWPVQVPPAKKEILFEANIQRWKSMPSLAWHVGDSVASPHNLDISVAFQLYQIDPRINKNHEQGRLLMKAAQIGDLAAVTRLLELGQVSDAHRFEAIGRAKKCDAQEEIIKKLQQDTKFTDELREAVMIGASTAGNLEMVKKMFEMGPISLECIVRAYLRANYHLTNHSSEKCGVIMQELRERSPEINRRLIPYEQEARLERHSLKPIYFVFNDLHYRLLNNEIN